MAATIDVLVIGAGPAALCIAAALAQQGLRVRGIAPHDPSDQWPNTFGIWGPEVDQLGLQHLLEHRWSNCHSYFDIDINHPINYGLFDKQALQQHWLDQCLEGAVDWQLGQVVSVAHDSKHSSITTAAGECLEARLVLDASGHHSPFVKRTQLKPVASQAAYGIVGRFSAPPVEPGQFVLMDYRANHLSEQERNNEPATFLYAMDFGAGLFFVEETSLALAPPVPYGVLKERLWRRLALRGIEPLQVQHEEFCLFPMNLALPDLKQQLLAFGSAASMVHPASGYLIGALLRRAPGFAAAIAAGLSQPELSSALIAKRAWRELWPLELRFKHAIYSFGLDKLIAFNEANLKAFFSSFFTLAQHQWFGFLTNTLSLWQLIVAMLQLFIKSPTNVRWGLIGFSFFKAKL